MKIKMISAAKGIVTYIPGIRRVLLQKPTGGTISAKYCYGVWMKHLTLLWENGLRDIPDTIAELGPGDSQGIGLAAMLCGVNNYYALDVTEYSNIETNLKIFDELVSLFKSRSQRPTKGWPDFDAYLDENLFPSHILTDEILNESLSDERVASIRAIIKNPGLENNGISIKYMVPWESNDIIEKNSVDVILSHSVFEHVVDLEATYKALYLWLKPNGMMSHQIDFKSHGVSTNWNGYRKYSEFLWKIICGRHTYLINRQPHSKHINLTAKNKFSLICDLKYEQTDGILRSSLSDHWQDISEEDLNCSGAFIQAQKQ